MSFTANAKVEEGIALDMLGITFRRLYEVRKMVSDCYETFFYLDEEEEACGFDTLEEELKAEEPLTDEEEQRQRLVFKSIEENLTALEGLNDEVSRNIDILGGEDVVLENMVKTYISSRDTEFSADEKSAITAIFKGFFPFSESLKQVRNEFEVMKATVEKSQNPTLN